MGALPFHRLSASITSWFRLPEQVCTELASLRELLIDRSSG